ncbi:MAG TPA: hypothetical protein VHI72_19955, partial [Hyphomicrobiaceae bacterium]|nr:hypothetical protein [Hyphomicrobiaceae bacterium]
MRRNGGRSWLGYAAERLRGLQGHHLGRGRTASSRDKAAGDIMFEVLETRVLPNVVQEIARGPLEYAHVWKIAQRQTRKAVKFGAISAQMLATGLNNLHYRGRRELIMALSSTARCGACARRPRCGATPAGATPRHNARKPGAATTPRPC